jgi:hypothetical protein
LKTPEANLRAGEEREMADKSNDPTELWRTMLGEMEKGFNSFANQAMASPEFSKVMNQASGATAGAQKQVGDLMERYLAGMNMPSRAQMTDFGDRLQSIERDVSEIKAMLLHLVQPGAGSDPAIAPARPARTRRPPSKEGGAA